MEREKKYDSFPIVPFCIGWWCTRSHYIAYPNSNSSAWLVDFESVWLHSGPTHIYAHTRTLIHMCLCDFDAKPTVYARKNAYGKIISITNMLKLNSSTGSRRNGRSFLKLTILMLYIDALQTNQRDGFDSKFQMVALNDAVNTIFELNKVQYVTAQSRRKII